MFYELRAFLGAGGDDIDIFEVQLGATWMLTDHLAPSAGWQDWDHSAEQGGAIPQPSDLELGLNGPFQRIDFKP